MEKRKFTKKLIIGFLIGLFIVSNTHISNAQGLFQTLRMLSRQGKTIKNSSELRTIYSKVWPEIRKIVNHPHNVVKIYPFEEDLPFIVNDNLKAIFNLIKEQGYNRILKIDRSTLVNMDYIDEVFDANLIEDLTHLATTNSSGKALGNYKIRLKSPNDKCLEGQVELLDLSIRGKKRLLEKMQIGRENRFLDNIANCSIILFAKYRANNITEMENDDTVIDPNLMITIYPSITFQQTKALRVLYGISSDILERLQSDCEYQYTTEFNASLYFLVHSIWELYHGRTNDSDERYTMLGYHSNVESFYSVKPTRKLAYRGINLELLFFRHINEFLVHFRNEIGRIASTDDLTNYLFQVIPSIGRDTENEIDCIARLSKVLKSR